MKKSKLTNVWRFSDNLFKSCMFADLFRLNVNAYLGLGQTSKMEFFAKILKAVNYFRKNSILDE